MHDQCVYTILNDDKNQRELPSKNEQSHKVVISPVKKLNARTKREIKLFEKMIHQKAFQFLKERSEHDELPVFYFGGKSRTLIASNAREDHDESEPRNLDDILET